MRLLRFLPLLAAALLAPAAAQAQVEIELDLTRQRAFVLQDGDIVYSSPISSGRSTHPTPTGTFKVTEKDLDHRSSLYGKVVDARGRTVKADADTDTPVPPGGRFVQAPMRYFLRFNGAVGMHQGILPGYAASHGCVRLPASKAALFYNVAQVGTPVRVHGRAPGRAATAPRSPDRYEHLDRYDDERAPRRSGGFYRTPPPPPPRERGPFIFRIF